MKFSLVLTLLIVLLTSPLSMANDDKEFATEDEFLAWAEQMWESLTPQTGDIELKDAHAVLHVPDSFYYLSPEDAEKVLVDIWGNPPNQNTLGMLFPSKFTPFDEKAWAVTVTYEEDGYVSDKDANDIDYSELLTQMKQDTEAASQERVNQGYEAIKLVGWATTPYYDNEAKKLYWAKEIKFGDQEINTLNFNIRVLGRKGVLLLNFIAGMDELNTIQSNLDTVLSLAEFDQGSRYIDFDPSIDKVAAYGIGALVAGKILSKTGLLVIALIFFKKFGIFIAAGIGMVAKKMFSKKAAERE